MAKYKVDKYKQLRNAKDQRAFNWLEKIPLRWQGIQKITTYLRFQ